MGKQKQKKPQYQLSGNPAYQRVNYLYQAAVFAASLGQTELAKYYSDCLQQVKEKGQVKLHHHIKRNLCRKCGVLLFAEKWQGARVKWKRIRKEGFLVVTCLSCGKVRRYKQDPAHKTKVEKQEEACPQSTQSCTL